MESHFTPVYQPTEAAKSGVIPRRPGDRFMEYISQLRVNGNSGEFINPRPQYTTPLPRIEECNDITQKVSTPANAVMIAQCTEYHRRSAPESTQEPMYIALFSACWTHVTCYHKRPYALLVALDDLPEIARSIHNIEGTYNRTFLFQRRNLTILTLADLPKTLKSALPGLVRPGTIYTIA